MIQSLKVKTEMMQSCDSHWNYHSQKVASIRLNVTESEARENITSVYPARDFHFKLQKKSAF
jgi:hypothetical protein